MKIYCFNKQYGQHITHFDSNFIMTRILQTNYETRIGCMHLENNGIIGYHQASVDQLLLIVNGDGWIRTSDTDQTAIHSGQAVFWKKGEWHETKTSTGLTAIVIESSPLNPDLFLTQLAKK
ncbi:cupin [Oceanobacillus sp. 1P07AA]|uniref:cupin n=1 Tax=Oceanobacillus sp. 1P07AA TaxID=3132293 RepID=UPI0039A776DC